MELRVTRQNNKIRSLELRVSPNNAEIIADALELYSADSGYDLSILVSDIRQTIEHNNDM